MTTHNDRAEAGPALAHPMRVTGWMLLAAVLAFGSSVGAAQPATQPAAQPADPGVAAFVSSRDTLTMRQVEPIPGWFERTASVAGGLLSIFALLLVLALIPVVWSFRKSHKAVQDMIGKLQADIAPVLRHADAISDDVNFITTAIRSDVQQVNQTVASINRRLTAAVEKAEERVSDLNALLEVAQEEAESAFISTASALRGIGTGAANLTGGDGRKRRRARDRELQKRMDELRAAIDEELHDAVEDLGPALEDSFAEEEEPTDADNGRSAADRGGETPRVRPRGGGAGHGD